MNYYFRRSAVCVAYLQEMEKGLDIPQIKLKKDHIVRWFAFCSATEGVYM